MERRSRNPYNTGFILLAVVVAFFIGLEMFSFQPNVYVVYSPFGYHEHFFQYGHGMFTGPYDMPYNRYEAYRGEGWQGIGFMSFFCPMFLGMLTIPVAYLLYKKMKNRRFEYETVTNYLTNIEDISQDSKLDFLDEWEKNIRREEKEK
jgi:hypothetical protein